MAFSLACDAGKTTLRIEGIDTNVTWNDVANAGAGSVAVDGGGTEDPSFFVTEHVANAVYQILKSIQFGDGTNALIFYSKKEMVYFDDDRTFIIKDNATLQLGEITGSYCINGASWSWEQGCDIIAVNDSGAVCRIYGSRMHFRGTVGVEFEDGTVDFRNSIFQADDVSNAVLRIKAPVDSIILKSLYINNWSYWIFSRTPDIMEEVWLHHTTFGLFFFDPATIENLLITDDSTSKVYLLAAETINLVNPQWDVVQADMTISVAGGIVNCRYTCDIHIADKDGNDLSGVTVLCEDEGDNQIFSVQTDGSGNIAQQTITYKKWEGTGETETTYSPHKFTFSKNGYELLVMENITVDGRINWDIEVKFPERIRARMANLGRLAILR